jgi:hypothetical protein
MNRRDFLKNAGAVIVPAAIPGALWGSGPNVSGADRAPGTVREFAPIVAVVFDQRYPDCRAFAGLLTSRGAKPFATNQDAAQLWYGPLRAHLAEGPGRVAGLTTYADFSVSQACGRELNFAQLYEGEHDGRRLRTNLAHRLRTKGDDREIAASLTGESWALQLAHALSRLLPPPEGASAIASPHSVTATTPRSAGHPGYLNSWLLSPQGS